MTQQRPQYGEIATPEEQRIAAGLPPLIEQPPIEAAPTIAATSDARVPRTSSRVDRFATVALLAYGLINVISTALSYLDLPTAMNEVMGVLGIEGEFTNYTQGRLWGTIAAIVLVAGWAITAYVSIRRLRRDRMTWWVPLVGAVATLTVAAICVTVAMMGDPAFIAFVEQSAGQ